ncbi:MAG TPA: alpha/beta hydrolase [Candidatus Acidoferrum sp.]
MRLFAVRISWLAVLWALLPVGAAASTGQKAVAAAQTSKAAPAVEGAYAGTLQAGEAKLHLVLHLSKAANGAWHASLDSLDQGVMAIDATSVALTGAALKLEVGSVGAKYEATISGDHQTIDGLWSQGSASLPLVLKRVQEGGLSRKPADAVAPVEGIWQGAVETQGLRLRFQLHVMHDSEGQLVAALDNIDQGVSGLPAIKVSQKESAVHFEVPAVGGVYDGTMNAAKNRLTGTWSQTGAEHGRLDFKRSDQPVELLRPQNPTKPYPYREEEVSFTNTAAAVTLSGTLTLPNGSGPFPGVLLIAGSGPQDRDGAVANHKPFLVLSDYLTRKGIAVLRYDKRGFGKSTGSPDAATTVDLAGDAEAGMAFLTTRKEIEATRIGLLGHSEGAMIAPLVASRSKNVAWLVLLSAPMTKGEDTLLSQSELIARAGGLTEPQLEASLEFDHAAYDLVRQEKDTAALIQKITKLVKDSGFDAALPPAALESQLRMLTSPWFRFFLDYDPAPNLQGVKCPVLALYGQKDLQVPSKVNLPMMRSALEQAGNRDVDLRELPDLNHLLQHAYSGSPAEYAAIDETISPEALQIIADWIQKHTAHTATAPQ